MDNILLQSKSITLTFASRKLIMEISYNWLKSIINIDETPEQLDVLLTDCGLEVEGIEPWESIRGGLAALVSGEVLTCTQHPNADRLKLTTVNIGKDEPLNIVCGAPNVAVGQKVIVALIGSTLYPSNGEPLTIKESKIRGELSQGMLCAEDELGLGQSHAGIIVLPENTEVGKPAAGLFGIETDSVISIGLTANRGDAASHLGVAIDLAALLDKDIHLPELLEPSGDKNITIQIDEPSLCPRYSALLMDGVKIGESPAWLKNKLKAIGLSPINNVVDCTNFVMHELGQPLHAFDADKIGDKIIIRKASQGEKLTTLDGTERTLKGHELLVCGNAGPLALAGVFGGKDSGVNEATTSLVLESAYFNPACVRKAAKTHDLSTDASFRFERGTDPEMTVFALKRLALLIQKTAGGQTVSSIVDNYPNLIPPHQVSFSLSKFYSLMGVEIAKETIAKILGRLGIKITKDEGDFLQLEVPARKADVTRPADVAEEIIRIYGLNKIPFPEQMQSNISLSKLDGMERFREQVSNHLAANGWNEIMNNSLTANSLISEENKVAAIKLINPLSSELDTMRTSLLPGCMQAIAYNRNRRMPDVRMFEFGRVYGKREKDFSEKQCLAMVACGNQQGESWMGQQRPSDFWFLKSAIENILKLAVIKEAKLEASDSTELDECLRWTMNTKEIARIGFVKNSWLKQYDVNTPVVYANLDWDVLAKAFTKKETRYLAVTKFPEVRRDLALVLDEKVNYAQIVELANKTERKLLKHLNCFDVYRGEKLAGKKSYAVSFHFVDEEKTLTDDTIDKTMKRLIAQFEKELGAEIRS